MLRAEMNKAELAIARKKILLFFNQMKGNN